MSIDEMKGIMDSASNAEEGMQEAMETVTENLNSDNDYLSKTIASYIRCAIENFHSKYLSDDQMAELNPLIRNAVFTFFEDFDNGNIPKIFMTRLINCPEYWEDCKYDESI